MVFQGMQNLPLLAAQSQGFFAKRGLNVDIRIAPDSDELREGLAHGRYQIVHAGVDNAVAMAEVAKIDIAIVMGGDNGFNRLIVQPEIKSYADLRGKTVIVDAPDTAFAFLMYEMLRKNGLNKGDYEVRPVGASFRRLEAMLKDKTAAAAMLNMPFTLRAAAAGLGDLGSAVEALGPYQGTGAFVLRQWAAGNSDVLVRYMQAYIEGLRWGVDPKNRADATKLYIDALKLNEAMAARTLAIAVASDRRTDARRAARSRRLQERAEPARQRDEAMGGKRTGAREISRRVVLCEGAGGAVAQLRTSRTGLAVLELDVLQHAADREVVVVEHQRARDAVFVEVERDRIDRRLLARRLVALEIAHGHRPAPQARQAPCCRRRRRRDRARRARSRGRSPSASCRPSRRSRSRHRSGIPGWSGPRARPG